MARTLFQKALLRVTMAGAALCAAGPMVTAAKADVELSQRGSVAYLNSEHLDPGDAEQVAAFLEQPRRQRIRIIYLNSRGGNTRAAIEIGQLIRQHGIDTGFHVGRGRCVSACTTMFLGGVNRYYIGGRGVSDGIATKRGLGFHPASGGGGGMGEGQIADYYRQMGVPGAAALRYKLYPRGGGGGYGGGGGGRFGGYEPDEGGYGPYGGGGYGRFSEGGPYGGGEGPYGGGYGGGKKKLFFAGGRSALRAGVATSTSEPRDAALRD